MLEPRQPTATPLHVFRPSVWLAIIPRAGIVIAAGALLAGYFTIGAIAGAESRSVARAQSLLLWAIVALLALELVRGTLMVLLFRYEYSHTHLTTRIGIFRRRRDEIALSRVQRMGISQLFIQRLCNTGSLDFAAADGLPVIWPWVAHPQKVAAELRDAIARAEGMSIDSITKTHLISPSATPALALSPDANFRAIGLVGGIGAGKSAVARILDELGFVVLDADKDAKAALDLPRVRDQLVAWWGSDILDPAGKIDRKRIASVIFANDAERKRLESLVHPIVTSGRATTIEKARREGKPGVVVDAPLLLEAGSDKDCDTVWFVDAPRDQRLRRVATRGWTEEELTRRESAQVSLAEKRARSNVVITNDADLETLRQRVLEALSANS